MATETTDFKFEIGDEVRPIGTNGVYIIVSQKFSIIRGMKWNSYAMIGRFEASSCEANETGLELVEKSE